VIDVPDTRGRYYVLQLLDAYSNTSRYVQRRAPGGRRRNWLPAPRGSFRLIMRLYEPRRRASSGDWRPPPVRRH
jgi:hypothetical protein